MTDKIHQVTDDLMIAGLSSLPLQNNKRISDNKNYQSKYLNKLDKDFSEWLRPK